MKLQGWIKVYCLLIGFRQHPDWNRASSRGREEALCRIVLPWVIQSSSVEFWIRDTRVLNPRSSTSLASATILHLRKVLRGTPVTSSASERLAPPFTREVTRTYLASMSGRENDRLFLLVWNVGWGAVGAAGPGLEACGGPAGFGGWVGAAAGGGWGDEEPVDVPGALGGVLVEEPGAVSEERACAIADGEESNFDSNP